MIGVEFGGRSTASIDTLGGGAQLRSRVLKQFAGVGICSILRSKTRTMSSSGRALFALTSKAAAVGDGGGGGDKAAAAAVADGGGSKNGATSEYRRTWPTTHSFII